MRAVPLLAARTASPLTNSSPPGDELRNLVSSRRVSSSWLCVDRGSVVHMLQPMAEPRPQPFAIHETIADLTFLPDRTPTTTAEESADAFARLCAYRDGAIFVRSVGRATVSGNATRSVTRSCWSSAARRTITFPRRGRRGVKPAAYWRPRRDPTGHVAPIRYPRTKSRC
jgi:hypothetical protein